MEFLMVMACFRLIFEYSTCMTSTKSCWRGVPLSSLKINIKSVPNGCGMVTTQLPALLRGNY